MNLDLWWRATFLRVHCKILRISLAFSVFQPWPCRGPSQASTYLLRICVPMSRNWRRSSVRSMESALQSSYLTAQKHISPIYIIVSRWVSEKMPGRKHKQLGSILQTLQDLKLSTKVNIHLQTGTQLWWCHEAPRRHSVSQSFAPEASASGNAPPPEYTVKNMSIRPDAGVWQHLLSCRASKAHISL